MASRKISELTALTAPASADVLPIVDVSEALPENQNKKITYAELLSSAPAGTAAAPSFAFDGDPDSGVYSAGANQLAISTGGTERLRITSAGLVGIGTSSPVVDLDVAPAASTATFRIHARSNTTPVAAIELVRGTNTTFGVDGNGDYRIKNDTGNLSFEYGDSGTTTERARIDSSGRLGIGTSSPGAILHTVNTSAGAATIGAFIQNSSLTAGTEVRLGFAPNSNLVSDNRYSWIAGVNDTGSNGSSLTFATTPGGQGATERMRLDGSGRLLVGTSTSASAANPQYARLQIVGNTAGSTEFGMLALLRSETATSITSGEILGGVIFGDSTGNEFGRIFCEADATAGSGDYPGRLVFSTTADGASSPTERMRIKNNGTINFSNVAVYADNAAATTGGLAVGDVYRTSTGQLMIRY